MKQAEGLHRLKELEEERSECEPPQVWRHGNDWTMLPHTIQGVGQSERNLERRAGATSCKAPQACLGALEASFEAKAIAEYSQELGGGGTTVRKGRNR